MRKEIPTPGSRLPIYGLYGEKGGEHALDRLHCEAIVERSHLHNWEVQAHRHELMTQLLLVERGSAIASLDDSSHTLQGPALLLVPALVAHGFSFSPATEGMVVMVHETHLGALLSAEPWLRRLLGQALAIQLQRSDPKAQELRAAALALHEEFAGQREWRRLALDAALLRLVVAVGRIAALQGVASAARRSRSQAYVERFRELVEREFRRQPRLGEFAAQLGIGAPQLNRVCQQVLGHSALRVLHARLLLEAKRELSYTKLSIKQVAHHLGFADAAYFTRFFQRETGLAPTAWRAGAAR